MKKRYCFTYPNSPTYYNDGIVQRRFLRLNRYSRVGARKIFMMKGRTLLTLLAVTLFTSIMIKLFVDGLDWHIRNTDRMLCESAKVSRNAEYLEKCECYYRGESIECVERR